MAANVSKLEIWYGLPNFPDNYFDFCLDIGARHGEVAELMLRRNPRAKVICYEPCKSNFEILSSRLPQVIKVNEALGDGRDLWFNEGPADDCHMFLPDKGTYKVKSVTLQQIFKLYNVQGHTQVTIDVEGGEWCLIDDFVTLQACESVAIELHCHPNNPNKNARFQNLPKWAVFQDWIVKTFGKTHKVIYVNSRRATGTGIYQIEKLDL